MEKIQGNLSRYLFNMNVSVLSQTHVCMPPVFHKLFNSGISPFNIDQIRFSVIEQIYLNRFNFLRNFFVTLWKMWVFVLVRRQEERKPNDHNFKATWILSGTANLVGWEKFSKQVQKISSKLVRDNGNIRIKLANRKKINSHTYKLRMRPYL